MRAIALALSALAALPAHAQRPAVSADLSPAAAAQAFQQAVQDVCVPAVVVGGVSSVAGGALQQTQDAETRRQTGAGADETVWDVAAARGVVAVRERPGRCVVSVYGPPSAPTIMGAMQGLAGMGFEAMAGAAGGGFTQTLAGSSGGKRVMVQLSGAEPGMPGHQSKFSVVMATVFAVQ